MNPRKQKPPHRLVGWSEVGEAHDNAPFVSIVSPDGTKGNGGSYVDKQEAFDIVTGLIAGSAESHVLAVTDSEHVGLLTRVCVERGVPFAWTPQVSVSAARWILRLVSHEGIGFTAPWSIVSAADAYIVQGGKHGLG